MRGGMSGCHPDATTKKIAGERETNEQNIRKRRDVDVRNANEMRTVEEANKRLMNHQNQTLIIMASVTYSAGIEHVSGASLKPTPRG